MYSLYLFHMILNNALLSLINIDAIMDNTDFSLH